MSKLEVNGHEVFEKLPHVGHVERANEQKHVRIGQKQLAI